LRRFACIAALGLGLMLGPAPGSVAQAAACRLALTLALDVSSSVDAAEYGLQLGGLADALEDPQVQRAIFQVPGAPVALQVFEWSGLRDQAIVQDWTLLRAPRDLARVVARLRGHRRSFSSGPTGLGAALQFAGRQLDRAPACALRKIDVSGDGQSNVGVPPQSVYLDRAFDAVVVNGLAIASDETALPRYYRFFVIHGDGAFVVSAADFLSYGAAMRTKLIRELGVPQLGMRR